MSLAYRRALLKISGEALAGERGIGLDYGMVEGLAGQIKGVHAQGVHLGLVVGGGNIVRGAHASREGLDRVRSIRSKMRRKRFIMVMMCCMDWRLRCGRRMSGGRCESPMISNLARYGLTIIFR
jgi:hypothetical protein